MFKQPLTYFICKPKNLLLLDGIGALLSAFLLGFVLVKFQAYFGIPKNTLYFLAAFPILFIVYDFFCYFSHIKLQVKHFQIIAFANLAYVFLSAGMAVYHAALITTIGWTYIAVEILILLYLIALEFKVALKVDNL